jgi:hypothetical protein
MSLGPGSTAQPKSAVLAIFVAVFLAIIRVDRYKLRPSCSRPRLLAWPAR